MTIPHITESWWSFLRKHARFSAILLRSMSYRKLRKQRLAAPMFQNNSSRGYSFSKSHILRKRKKNNNFSHVIKYGPFISLPDLPPPKNLIGWDPHSKIIWLPGLWGSKKHDETGVGDRKYMMLETISLKNLSGRDPDSGITWFAKILLQRNFTGRKW
jgi:hypothetical protein